MRACRRQLRIGQCHIYCNAVGREHANGNCDLFNGEWDRDCRQRLRRRPPDGIDVRAGQLAKTVLVSVLGDTVVESNKTFFLNLSNPTNAILADAQGMGTIIDDDATLIGSEAFGYSAFTHPFENINLVPGATGVTTIRPTGDNNANTVNLASGNTFNFYGTSYTSLRISTNGLITFGTSNTSATNTNLTSSPTQRHCPPVG